MNLNDAQKQSVAQWLKDGLNVADVQKKIASDFGVSLTYMEVRFLVDDLKVMPKDEEPPAKITTAAVPVKSIPADAKQAGPSSALAGSPATGSVSVSIDQVTRPGAMISGKVTFTDGKAADWYLDQNGRLGLAPQQEGYRPSQQDLMLFQSEVQKELQRAGF